MISAGRCGTILLVAACGTATVAAAGCGGGSSANACASETTAPPATTSNSHPQGAVQRAAARTVGAGSSRFTMQAHFGSAIFSASGLFDYHRARGLLYYALGDTNSPSHTFGSYAPAAIEYRLVGGCEYFKTSQGGGGKPWSSIDLDKLGGKIGVGLSGPDPGQSLAALRRAGRFERAGVERVRGVETTRYREHGAPTEVWVDRSGYVRKLATVLQPGGSRQPLTQTTQFYGFGVPVRVTVPPSDQVQDVTDQFKSELS